MIDNAIRRVAVGMVGVSSALLATALVLGHELFFEGTAGSASRQPAVEDDYALGEPAPPRFIRLEYPDDPPAARSPATVGVRGGGSGPVVRGPFRSIQVNVDSNGDNIPGDAANEPSLAIDPTDPSRIAIGWRQFDSVASNFRQAGWGYSADSGQSWTFPGVIQPGVFRSDPVLDSDPNGIIYYYSLKSDFLCDMYESSNGGATWNSGVPAFGGDKAWMTIDRTNGLGQGNIYIAWSRAAGCCGSNTFTRSTNGGSSFMIPISMPNTPTFGTLSVGPDGELYVSGVDAPSSPNDRFYVAKSTNAMNPAVTPSFDFATRVNLGGSLSIGGVNPAGLLGQVWVATDHTNGPTRGNVYLLCSVNPSGPDPLDVMFSRSTDGGLTWSVPVRVNDDPPGTNAYQWFGTMAVAPDGRIDVIWNDTRLDPIGAFTSELYYAFSPDAGATWSKNIPVSPPFVHSLGYPDQNKLGDYYDAISDVAAVNVAYAATFNEEQDVYFIRIGDCNANGVHDSTDIASGTSADCNGNEIPDECEAGPLFGDFDVDGDVDLNDFAGFHDCFGGPDQPPSPTPPAQACECLSAFDAESDGDVDLIDLAAFLAVFVYP